MAKVITLGEIMLRLSTTIGNRVASSTSFEAHYGGGEANVGISLANFGHEVGFATKIPDNELGTAVLQHLRTYGISTKHVLVGGKRLGTYYMEAGVGERSARVIYDRAGSSFAEMISNEWEDDIFESVDILHVSGITPALSTPWQALTVELIQAAKSCGVKVNFDINYRGKLWTQAECGAFLAAVLPLVDYLSAGKMDAVYLLGIEEKEGAPVQHYYEQISSIYPNIETLYSTIREVVSASHNTLTGTMWQKGQYVESMTHDIQPIVDRVGGGDAFTGGVLHGVLSKKSLQETIDFATAASALKHTVHGDTNQFSEAEVEQFLAAGSGKIVR